MSGIEWGAQEARKKFPILKQDKTFGGGIVLREMMKKEDRNE